MKKKMIWAALLVCLMIGLVGSCKATDSDFKISNGQVFAKYTGSASVVTVPDGITLIDSYAFKD